MVQLVPAVDASLVVRSERFAGDDLLKLKRRR